MAGAPGSSSGLVECSSMPHKVSVPQGLEELWQLSPRGKGKRLYPTVHLTAPHHQNKNTTVLIAMENSIPFSGIGTN